MGFVSEELNETEKQLIKDGKASNMAVVYGKEASIWKVSPSKPTANHTGSNSGHTHNTCCVSHTRQYQTHSLYLCAFTRTGHSPF